mmetsp:Transcript_85866/g.229751  ORF Transcript_85866/g.229751 Transcript_85866/m.229751 type:complete len:436 (-) Transcript_85866:65-1372(-)
MPQLVESGQWVILEGAQGDRVLAQPKQGTQLRMGKIKIPSEVILGQPLGATFRLEAGQWSRRRPIPSTDDVDETTQADGTNRYQSSEIAAQSMTAEAIAEMKKDLSPTEVAAAIAAQSATFEGKTAFSKQKYLLKKARKHAVQITLWPATLMGLCETYGKLSPAKISNLRFDHLVALLNVAAVRHGSRVLVLESCMGLVVGAIAQRLAGGGKIFSVYDKGVSDKILHQIGLTEEEKNVVWAFPLGALEQGDKHEFLQRPVHPGEPQDDAFEQRFARKTQGWEKRLAQFNDLQRDGVDSVVVALDSESQSAFLNGFLAAGMRLLRPGGTLGIYGPSLQPLACFQAAMRASTFSGLYTPPGDGAPQSFGFVNIRLEEFWLREYQVLPQRTHPMMNAQTNLVSGFLLSGVKIVGQVEASDDGGLSGVRDTPEAKRLCV